VDDNATNRRILVDTLRGWKMESIAVESGPLAIAALERAHAAHQPIHVILLDCHMPGMDGFQFAEYIRKSSYLGGATIMMLTSSNQREDTERCRELGLAAYLVKPVSQAELRTSMLEVLSTRNGPRTPAIAVTEAPAPHRPRKVASAVVKAIIVPLADGTTPRTVLLAEDNPVNQKIVVALLSNLGHRVVLATTGSEALQATRGHRLDLVLMDVQMPIMGGLEAAQKIREEERGTGRRVPIIALTAHAMKGDEERCLAAGMDGYLTKPLVRARLMETLEEYFGAPEQHDRPGERTA